MFPPDLLCKRADDGLMLSPLLLVPSIAPIFLSDLLANIWVVVAVFGLRTLGGVYRFDSLLLAL